jgi:hypothetical protein
MGEKQIITEQDLVYNIIFDIPKEGKIEVNKFVEGMKECLMALEEINHAIVGSIDNTIQVVSYIEALEAGSFIYKLKDKVINQTTEIAVAVTAAACGDYSSAVGLLLKNSKDAFVAINNERIENKEKEKKICNAIKKELQNSGINNELKGYLLDEKKLIKAVKHFARGVKKTNGNVFWQKDDNAKKLQIDSTIGNDIEIDSENNTVDIEQELPPQTINAHIKVYKACFEKTDKWQFTLNGKTETIDISECDVTSYMKNKWVNGDTFYAKLEFIERKTKAGYTNDYKVIEVLTFTRGSEQADLYL